MLYAEIRDGRLKARKIGRRTIILSEDLRDFLAQAPRLPHHSVPAPATCR